MKKIESNQDSMKYIAYKIKAEELKEAENSVGPDEAMDERIFAFAKKLDEQR